MRERREPKADGEGQEKLTTPTYGDKRYSRTEFELFDALMGVGAPPDVFRHMPDEEKALILKAAQRRVLAPGEELFFQGVEEKNVYIIETGLIRAFYTAPSGREITLAYWPPGSMVGSPEVVRPAPHMWTGVAYKDTTLIGLSGRELHRLMEKYPRLAIGMVEAIAYKTRCFSSLVQILGTRSIKDRLLQVILALADQYGVHQSDGSVLINLRFTHEDLARMTGSSRQWVTMTLDKFQTRKIIKIGKRRLVLLKPDILLKANKGQICQTDRAN